MEIWAPDLGTWQASVLVLLISTCLVLLYIYGKYPYSLWKQLGVPGPEPSLFLGNIPDLYSPESSKAAYAKWQSQYGRTYGAYFFRYPSIVTTDPELIKQVLVKDFNNYRDRFSYDGNILLNHEVATGVFFARGNTWKRIRGVVTPSFSTAKIKSMTNIVNNSARRLAQHVLECAKRGTALDVKLLFGAFALDVVTGTGFSIDVDSVRNLDEPFTRHGRSLFIYKKSIKLLAFLAAACPSVSCPIFKTLNTGFFKREDMDFFKCNINRMIEERRLERGDTKRVDFLQLLIDAMDCNSGRLSKDEIVAQSILFFLAGYETSSSTLQFLAYELARHPEVIDKIIAEIDRVVGSEEPTYDACLNLKYTEAVIFETLRMYPPLSVINRQTEKAVTLNGINLPPFTGVTIPLYVLGRDPEFWENPDEFNPQRFIVENGSPACDPFTFLPFGMGPRICVGMKLGLFEMKLALIHVFRKVVFTKASPEVLHIDDFTAILQPSEPIMVHAQPRDISVAEQG